MKISKIKSEHYDGYVYDVSVEKNHNFIANGVVIHNCRKKKYWLNVSDNEGVRYHEPHLAITGLETQRSSTPAVIRKALYDAYMIITNNNEEKLQEFVKDFKQKYMELSPAEIGFPTSANNIEKFLKPDGTYKKGSEGATPIGVRSAILYNKYIKEHNVQNIYSEIKSGEKLKYLMLKKQNPSGENVVGFTDDIPEEFDLKRWIDYETNFKKGFLEPLNSICEVIGWNTEKVYNLDEFF